LRHSTVNDTFGKKGADLGRRRILKLGALGLLAGLCPSMAWARIPSWRSPVKSLSLYNTHTEESLETIYWSEGRYLEEPLAEIDYIMRDHRTGEIKSIDPRLLDLLDSIKKRLGVKQPFHIISGYRSPETNAFLRKTDKGVACKSLHIKGKAVDIRLPDIELSALRKVTMDFRRGGVGYYPKSDFVHVDLGRLRYWAG
jgi:uncharacterized protein YcbK (DUF882 family)